MKILFIADVHIKLGQKNVPIDWAKNRYEMMIEQISLAQDKADLVVFGGDVFDRVPTMDELEIYFELVASMTKPTVIYDGNHEALKKGTTFFTYLKRSTSRLNKLVEVIDDYHTIDTVDFIPYCKLKDYETNNRVFNGTVLCTHVRGEIPPHVKPEVDLSIFDRWQTVLAGDLHSYANCQRNILYPGSPVTTSFHRGLVDTGAILFDTDVHQHTWVKFELPQLIRKTIKAGESMEATSFHHTIFEIEGDMSELGTVVDSDLIDKKIVKREVDTALMLEPNMSLQEELQEYLLYILQLDEAKASQLVDILNNNLHKITIE